MTQAQATDLVRQIADAEPNLLRDFNVEEVRARFDDFIGGLLAEGQRRHSERRDC